MVAPSAVMLRVIAIKVLLLKELMAGPAASQATAEDEVKNIPFLLGFSESSLTAIGAHSAG